MNWAVKLSGLIIWVMVFVMPGQAQQLNDEEALLPRLNPTPWTDSEPFNNSDSTFRFAVMSDRTGGMQPGIFAEGIRKVNMMQPEFVMSVGDLIDGYTEVPAVWNRQWAEVDSLVGRLEMPFFFVPGNHDISNKQLKKVWEQRVGPTYYHFKYKNVLFLCLNTEDVLHNGGISNKQFQYFRKVLRKNADVRWTFVFMHRPLWAYGNQAGFEKVAELLADRNHTVISGHHHNYQYVRKNDADHIVLATTGGGSNLRGEDVGEFNHITWVTMKDRPTITHLKLNGILPKDVVPEEDYPLVQVLRNGNWMEIEPVVHQRETFTNIKTRFILTNPSNRPMQVTGELKPTGELTFSPEKLQLTVPAKDTLYRELAVRSDQPISIEELNNHPPELELRAGYSRKGRKNLQLPTSRVLVMDWNHVLPYQNKVRLDADLAEWDTDKMITVKKPQFFEEGWAWRGVDDAWFRFGSRYDDENLYIGVEVHDNKLLFDPHKLQPLQDKITVWLDSRPADQRNKYEEESITGIEVAPGQHPTTPHVKIHGRKVDLRRVVMNTSDDGRILLELAVPLRYLESQQGEDWKSVRINIEVMDRDRPENNKPSRLWWRPRWDDAGSYEGSSTFYRSK